MTGRIEGSVVRSPTVSFTFDGESVSGVPGECLAVALLAAGRRRLRHGPRTGSPRGVFCMMGSCQECLVRVGGQAALACMEPVREGMVVSSGGAS